MTLHLQTPTGTLTVTIPADAAWSPQAATRAMRDADAPNPGAMGRLAAAVAELDGVIVTVTTVGAPALDVQSRPADS